MIAVNRDPVYQQFSTFVIAVATTPTPLNSGQNITKLDLIDAFTLSLDAAAANNVFIGDQGVTVNSGLEIVAGGGPITFRIRNQRQHYELQEPLILLTEAAQCQGPVQPRSLPFLIWDFSQIYLVAAAATNIRCAPWRAQFI